MNIPRGTIHKHKKRAQTRKGKANPIKHKRVMPSKITENGGRFLLQSVTDNNTITLDQLQHFVKNYIEIKILDYQHNCVFVDEASVMANMRHNYAWSVAGEVAHVKEWDYHR
ncbi:hypothetical protein INT45_009471 [Circinella minor]|uniref:Uncharacterized protein n=1 Tax=Circinella minor TaxID=1195481 RepID=A0A8H7RSF3_9FUNG|nr:hypothetical protein INT45_009471 [Circinella minor]